MADDIAVMYAGGIVEHAPAAGVIERALHPYTRALLETTPRMNASRVKLPAISGRVPAPDERGPGCPFQPRCTQATDLCKSELPRLTTPAQSHLVACHAVGTGTPGARNA